MDMNARVDVRDVARGTGADPGAAPHRRHPLPRRGGAVPRRPHPRGTVAAAPRRGPLRLRRPGPDPRPGRAFSAAGPAEPAHVPGRGGGSGGADRAGAAAGTSWSAAGGGCAATGGSGGGPVRRTGRRGPCRPGALLARAARTGLSVAEVPRDADRLDGAGRRGGRSARRTAEPGALWSRRPSGCCWPVPGSILEPAGVRAGRRERVDCGWPRPDPVTGGGDVDRHRHPVGDDVEHRRAARDWSTSSASFSASASPSTWKTTRMPS